MLPQRWDCIYPRASQLDACFPSHLLNRLIHLVLLDQTCLDRIRIAKDLVHLFERVTLCLDHNEEVVDSLKGTSTKENQIRFPGNLLQCNGLGMSARDAQAEGMELTMINILTSCGDT